MLGALCRYVTEAEPKTFQPMKANLGLLEALVDRPPGRPERAKAYAERSAMSLSQALQIVSEPCA